MAELSHTKELEGLQFLEFWMGNCEEINLCPICHGTGEIGYAHYSEPINVCKLCNGSGRVNS